MVTSFIRVNTPFAQKQIQQDSQRNPDVY